ncbi:MAG: RloB family protein [Bacteroidales bacterium]|nr:RloB family protein [Bacteroidales bacterium]
MSKRRVSRNISFDKRVLILCEGLSEKIYINGYKSEPRNRDRLSKVEIEVYQPHNYSPYGLLTEAKKRKTEAEDDGLPYESVWIVFDRDGHQNIPKTFEESADSDINIAFSVVCFEYWILLHFETTSRGFRNCDEILSYINRKNYLTYHKTNYYDQLRDKSATASENAKLLHATNKPDIESGIQPYELKSYTDFDKLFIFLETINNH